MRLIRNGVFETNSSSCHSISVGKGDTYIGLAVNRDNNIVIPPQDFGWECQKLTDVNSRLAYVWTYIKDWSGVNQEKYLRNFKQVVKAHTLCDDVFMAPAGMYEPFIDHQSVENGELNGILEDKKMLKKFLFDPTSYIITDHDNWE